VSRMVPVQFAALRRPLVRWLLGLGIVLSLGLGVLVILFLRHRRRRNLPARAVIVSPRRSTVISSDQSVRSVQSAELTISRSDLERLWNPTNMENLARTYWRFLTTVTLGLVRVVYSEQSRSVVLLGRPLTLLRFEPPEYRFDPTGANVTWKIRDGLLVARRGQRCGRLALDVHVSEHPAPPGQIKLRIEVEVANFYPAIAAGLSTPVYEATQSLLHVMVTHAFLRSLAKLELAESKVGRVAALVAAGDLPAQPAAPASPVAPADDRSQLGAVVPGADPPHRPRA
jgi:hypothetical protein